MNLDNEELIATKILNGSMSRKEIIEYINKLKKEFSINTEIHKRDLEIKDLKETIECLHESAEKFIRKSKIQDTIEKLKVLAETSDDEMLTYCELDIRKN